MNQDNSLQVSTTEEFRDWLTARHGTASEVWLIVYQKTAHKPGPDLAGAVEEALCFGWIDGKIKSVDDERYAIRFTPRRKSSRWSETNRKTAKNLIREGKMTPAGLAALPADFLPD